MCGIAGIIHKDKNKNIKKMLYEILFNLQHRGQDSCGLITYDNINKKCNIIIVGVPLDDSYESDLKLFKDNKDISDKVGEYEINGEGLKKMLDTIDNL